MAAPTGVLRLPRGADPLLARPLPDVEQRVHDVIRELGGTQVWMLALNEADPRLLAVASVQVDVRASDKRRAFTRADAARRAIAAMPSDRSWAEGQVCRVDTIDGPFWLPDDTGAPRYVARYRIVFRPARRRS